MRSLILASLLFVGLAACTESLDSNMTLQMVPSTGVATSDLKATFSVSGEVDKATVSATVFFTRKARDEVVYLAGDDAAYVDGQRLASTFAFENGIVELPRKAPGETYHFEVRGPQPTRRCKRRSRGDVCYRSTSSSASPAPSSWTSSASPKRRQAPDRARPATTRAERRAAPAWAAWC